MEWCLDLPSRLMIGVSWQVQYNRALSSWQHLLYGIRMKINEIIWIALFLNHIPRALMTLLLFLAYWWCRCSARRLLKTTPRNFRLCTVAMSLASTEMSRTFFRFGTFLSFKKLEIVARNWDIFVLLSRLTPDEILLGHSGVEKEAWNDINWMDEGLILVLKFS